MKKRTILLIGKNGQLGSEIHGLIEDSKFSGIAVDYPEFDITDPALIHTWIDGKNPDLVINAAGFTDVDKAETSEDLVCAVNSKGPAMLAEACSKRSIPLIHISTDYVFDGRKGAPYLEDDAVNPLNVYGKSKREGEIGIRSVLKKHIIIRTAWLYGLHGRNFVKTMLKLAAEKEKITVVDDQYGCPTSSADLAEAVLAIAGRILSGERESWGIYHYAGKGSTTWYEFAVEIFKQAANYTKQKLPAVYPVPAAQYGRTAPRPENTTLDCTKIADQFGIETRCWKEGLAKMMGQLFNREPVHPEEQ